MFVGQATNKNEGIDKQKKPKRYSNLFSFTLAGCFIIYASAFTTTISTVISAKRRTTVFSE